MIKVGDALPAATLMEYVEVEGNGCSVGPNPVDVAQATAGKTIALFAVPGAFTPTCSAQHVPGYVEQAEAFKAAGVDEIWCVAVNDAFVMGAWAREQHTAGKVRMLADGDATFSKAVGLTLDLHGKGLGLRAARYSMLVRDGKVERLNRTFKASYRVTCGYDNFDGANYALSLWVAYYNFLRPHRITMGDKPLNELELLSRSDNMPGKWQLLIYLGQKTILQMQTAAS